MASSQITPAQARILGVLRSHDGRELTAGEIRDILGQRTQSPITNALGNLKIAGLVASRASAGTGWYRDRFYSLTEKGRRF
jgi:DNA-binding MarR family transcriptional regulator